MRKVALLTLIFVAFFVLFSSNAFSTDYSTWGNYSKIYIYGSSNMERNYQLINLTNIDTSNSEWQSDCKDVRVLCNGEEKELMIENCKTTYTNITFIQDVNGTSTFVKCYLYWNNSEVTESNNTMWAIWEDFNESTKTIQFENSTGGDLNIRGEDCSNTADGYLNLTLFNSAPAVDFITCYYNSTENTPYQMNITGTNKWISADMTTPNNAIYTLGLFLDNRNDSLLAPSYPSTDSFSDVYGWAYYTGASKRQMIYNQDNPELDGAGGLDKGTPDDTMEDSWFNAIFGKKDSGGNSYTHANLSWANGSFVYNGVAGISKVSLDDTSTTLSEDGWAGLGVFDASGTWKWAAFDNICMTNASYPCKIYSTTPPITILSQDENSISISSQVSNDSVYETSSGNFSVNITIDIDNPLSSVKLIYNDTEYTSTLTDEGSGIYFAENTLDIPAIVDYRNEKYFHYEYTFSDGVIDYSSNYSQNITEIMFILCNDTYSDAFLNISFLDEDDNSHVDGRIDFEANYYLGTGAFVEKLDYDSSTTHDYNFTFCGDPTNQTIYLNSTKLDYKNDTSYALRSSTINLVLTNSTTEQYLYLLSDADGQYVTFQVVSGSDQPISGVNVLAQRTIEGTLTTLGDEDTNDAGLVTFWLNPDFTHTFTFTKAGYDTYTTSMKPTQSSYTVTLSTTAAVNGTEYARGVYFSIEPKDFVLTNSTDYLFAFNITSDYFVLDSYGFILYNTSDSYLDEASGTSSSGGNDAFVVVNTGNNTGIKMEWYYYTNSTYINGTYVWSVNEVYEGNFSMMNFFDDVKGLVGHSGFNEFSLALIAIIITFVLTGVICYVSGIQSPLAIVGMVCGLTAMFDYVGFYKIVNPAFEVGGEVIWNGEYFVTIMCLLIFVGYLFYEIREQRS